MKRLQQMSIIFALAFAGELLRQWIPLPIPASVYGLLLLLTLLTLRVIRVEQVEDAANVLLDWMPVMFVPACVGVMRSAELVLPVWLPFALICLSSTVVVMLVSGRVTQRVLRWRRKR